MRSLLLSLLLTAPLSVLAQSNTQTSAADLPAAPLTFSASLDARGRSCESRLISDLKPRLRINRNLLSISTTATISITRTDAERLALKNNPRITASHLLALAAGQVTRETRSRRTASDFRRHHCGKGRGRKPHRRRRASPILVSTRTPAPAARSRNSLPTSVIHTISSRPTSCNRRLKTRPHSLPSKMSCWQRTRHSTACLMHSLYSM